MQLLTPELRAQLPRLYTQETEKDPIVHLQSPGGTPDHQHQEELSVTTGRGDGLQ